MFTTIQFQDVKRADVRSLRKEILQAIADLKNGNGGVSMEAIAYEVSCGRRTVLRHINALRISGHLTTTNNKPLRYTLTESGERSLRHGKHPSKSR